MNEDFQDCILSDAEITDLQNQEPINQGIQLPANEENTCQS